MRRAACLIYTCRVLRNRRDPLLDVFHSPEGFASTSQGGNATTTPAQALSMINGPFLEQGGSFGDATIGRYQRIEL